MPSLPSSLSPSSSSLTVCRGRAELLPASTGVSGGLGVDVEGPGLWEVWEELRRLSSLPAVADTGATHGFRVEDLVTLEVDLPAGSELGGSEAEAWLRRRVPATELPHWFPSEEHLRRFTRSRPIETLWRRDPTPALFDSVRAPTYPAAQ